MNLLNKYLNNLFIIVVCCLLQQCCLGQSTTVRPYKFGFTIDEQQHRSEQRDERGIVMGEFGFITADGIYHVTVYATDEQGRFRILAMKNYPYESPPKTVEVMVQPKIPPKTTTTTTTRKPLPKYNFNNEACSGCFLTNGNNKPKAVNGLEEKPLKSEIRPLSKTFNNQGSSSAAIPKVPNQIPSTEPLVFEDLNALKTAVIEQQINPLTLASLVLEDQKMKPLILAPKIMAAVMLKEKEIKTKTLLLKDKVKTMALTVNTDLKDNTQAHKAPHIQHLHPTPIKALSNLKNKNNNINRSNNNDTPLITDATTLVVDNVLKASKIKSINFLNHELNLPTNTAKQENTLFQTPQVTTDTKLNEILENSLQNSLEPPLETENSGKPKALTNKQKTHIRYTTTPTIGQKQAPFTTNQLQKSYTTAPTIITLKPSQGGSGPLSTPTGSQPPIMDIIMQKVLPALMGNNGKTPSSSKTTQTTTPNKTKASPGNKPSTTITGSKANNPAGGNTGLRSSINDDGDLYRFKYILDYHGHSETGKRNGNKQGTYFSVGDDDVERTIEYVANEFGYQPRIRWRKLDRNEIKSKENTLKDYEFVWFTQ
ncbi:lethal (3) malignant blood neoplasm isoform 1-T1 [Cochliomyia hominivorax]